LKSKFSYLIFAATLAACESNIEKVRELNDAQSVPSLHIFGLDGRSTELGKMKAHFVAAEMKQFHFAEEKYTEFPQGVAMDRYLDSATIESSITADKAVNHEAKELWEATGRVVVENHIKRQKLETEKLFWDQKNKKIYTDAWVKITKEDTYVQGIGMEADESFDTYVVKRVFDGVTYYDDKK
jgi:LPS export ABC transporter protein LptC